MSILLLLGSLPAGIAGASGTLPAADTGPEASPAEPAIAADVSDGSSAMADADEILHRTTELRHLPDQPGGFEVEMTFELPTELRGLEIGLESEADVQETDGFESTGERTYRWDETADEPTVRFTMPADRTGDGNHDHAQYGGVESGASTAPATAQSKGSGYTFVDTGDWGVVQVPGVDISYQTPNTVTVGVEKTTTIDGPGATGDNIAFFGPVEEYERTVDGETIRLVVPEAADLRERPDGVLDSLEAARDRLSVGATDPETFIVAVPTDVDWGPRGIQYGQSDAWVVADAGLEEPSNVWLHEYAHVRQSFANSGTTTDAKWIVEAQAEYYASLLAYEQGLISFSEFSSFLERGERAPYADGALADPSTWDDENTDYVKGPLVYGELDRQLRLATDGDRSADDVFRALNAQDGQVTEADVLEAFEKAGGEEIRTVAEEYTQTTATPSMWSRADHSEAFDQARADIEYGLGSDPITLGDVAWERWDRADLDGPAGEVDTADVMAVPVDESVTVPVTAENVDDRSGTADATVTIDGKIVDYSQSHLDPGERVTERLSWTPTEPGVYDLRVGSDRVTVFVRSTSSLTVTDLGLDPDPVETGEPTTVTASVTNDGTLPAAGSLEFRTAAASATGQPVALAPGESGTVEGELTFSDDRRYEVTAGEASSTVTVGGVRATLEAIPGFGVVSAVVALGVLLAVAVVSRRR